MSRTVLDIELGEDGAYTTYNYQLSRRENDPSYESVKIGGQAAFRQKGVRNEISLIRLSNGLFVVSIDLNKYEDTCVIDSVECGYRDIADKETSDLFNQILSTFKFTK